MLALRRLWVTFRHRLAAVNERPYYLCSKCCGENRKQRYPRRIGQTINDWVSRNPRISSWIFPAIMRSLPIQCSRERLLKENKQTNLSYPLDQLRTLLKSGESFCRSAYYVIR